MENAIRIGCAVPKVSVADPQTNSGHLCAYIRQAAEAGCDLLIFPELCVTGYTCGDLFFQQLLIRAAEDSVKSITEFTAHFPGLYTVIGAPLRIEDRLYNCGVVLKGGSILGILPKYHLTPAEQRWFSDAPVKTEAETRFVLDGDVSFSVQFGQMKSCDSQIVVHLTARPALVDDAYRRKLQYYTAQNRCICASVSAGPWESGQDMVYSGESLIMASGILQKERRLEADYLLLWDADVQSLSAAPVFPKAEAVFFRPDPFYKGEDQCREIFQIQATGLANRLRQLGCKPVIGVSGGLDSTLALLVAVEAVKKNGRPASDVCAVTMPGFGTSGRTYENAQKLMQLLGVHVKEVDIRAAVKLHFENIGHDIAVRNATYENAQARERTQILMDYASVIGGIVVGTGDLSELALGWCTYNGDHMSMYSVNASVPKTLIPPIIRTVTRLPDYLEMSAVLEDIIATPISPELLPPDEDGILIQQTEDLVGPYVLHDFFLYYTLSQGTMPGEIYTMACQTFAETFDKQTVKKWLKVFYRRFFSQQFKRSCLPEGVKVSSISLGPRGDWCMPSDASVNLWLADVEKL